MVAKAGSYTISINKAKEFSFEKAKAIIEEPYSNKVMHKKSELLPVAELHINTESQAWVDYLHKYPSAKPFKL